MGAVSIGAGTPAAVFVPSGFVADRLLWLQALLMRQRTAEQTLYGPERARAHALLRRAIFSLYLDCRAAGAEAEAQRLIAAATETPAAVGSTDGRRPAPCAPRHGAVPATGGECDERDRVAQARS